MLNPVDAEDLGGEILQVRNLVGWLFLSLHIPKIERTIGSVSASAEISAMFQQLNLLQERLFRAAARMMRIGLTFLI